MDHKKSSNSFLSKLIIIFASVVLSCLFMLIIFSIFVPADPATETIPEKYDKWIGISGVALALIINFIVDYNSTTKLKYSVSKSEAEITAAKERNDALLEKATRVTEKYAKNEKELFSQFAHARQAPSRIRTSGEFRGVIESYPELKANEHVHKLLSQIENSENLLFNAKTNYADKVAEYNTKIHSFPIALYRKLFKWEDIENVKIASSFDDISDEDLGI